mmetsp:Transcript_66025/g.190469  ORF Transcript_66025/g.190469 Transcript_66025/m.190469 type:complete len:311 (+) Transcript_66025:1083-2015(+)
MRLRRRPRGASAPTAWQLSRTPWLSGRFVASRAGVTTMRRPRRTLLRRSRRSRRNRSRARRGSPSAQARGPGAPSSSASAPFPWSSSQSSTSRKGRRCAASGPCLALTKSPSSPMHRPPVAPWSAPPQRPPQSPRRAPRAAWRRGRLHMGLLLSLAAPGAWPCVSQRRLRRSPGPHSWMWTRPHSAPAKCSADVSGRRSHPMGSASWIWAPSALRARRRRLSPLHLVRGKWASRRRMGGARCPRLPPPLAGPACATPMWRSASRTSACASSPSFLGRTAHGSKNSRSTYRLWLPARSWPHRSAVTEAHGS